MNETLQTQLFNACKNGDDEIVAKFLQQDFGLSETMNGVPLEFFPLSETYLYDNVHGFHVACTYGKIQIVNLFLKYGYFVSTPFHERINNTGFLCACRNGHLDLIKLLVKYGVNIHTEKTRAKATGFHFACIGGHLEVVKYFIEKNFDITSYARGFEYSTGFHAACAFGHAPIVSLILQNSKSPLELALSTDRKTRNGFHLACEFGHLNVIQKVLQQIPNFDLNIQSEYAGRKNGFQHACTKGRLNVVRYFVEKLNYDISSDPWKFWVTYSQSTVPGYDHVSVYLLEMGCNYVHTEITNSIRELVQERIFDLQTIPQFFRDSKDDQIIRKFHLRSIKLFIDFILGDYFNEEERISNLMRIF